MILVVGIDSRTVRNGIQGANAITLFDLMGHRCVNVDPFFLGTSISSSPSTI